MDERKRIDKILDAIEAKIQDEVGTLLGSSFSVIGGSKELLSKAEIFDRLVGKQVCAHLDIIGEVSGIGHVFIGIKDAIRLGGTLIMLPEVELQEVIGREEYREEVEDSYGEIANIIAGVITKNFEEMYPKPCRFVRKEQKIIVPAKVDIQSEEPIQNHTYYMISSAMLLDGKQMGDLVLLLPALAFDLITEESVATEDPASAEIAKPAESEKPVLQQQAAAPVVEAEPEQTATTQEEPQQAQPAPKPKIDFEKQKRKIDGLLEECRKKLSQEVSALLGAEVEFAELDNRFVGKEDFFSESVTGKQIVAQMDVVGDTDSVSFFACGLKDAIHAGGVLIMLPPTELANIINEEDFSDDCRDAYGEVANIVSGVYTAVFEEQYPEKIRFIKKELKEVLPLKVEVASSEPLPDGKYYQHGMQLLMAGKQLGNVYMLFPVELLHLDVAASKANVAPEESVAKPSPMQAAKAPASAEEPLETIVQSPATPPKTASPGAKEAAEKQKKLVDKLLAECIEKMTDELSALLGTNVRLSNHGVKITTKEAFFFEEVSGKQVCTIMDAVGETEGKCSLVFPLRDAIRAGGVLIMLPTQELESVVSGDVFAEDTKDAFGEIANIIAGVYTAVFEEQYSKKLRFIKKDLLEVIPMKVDIASAEPFNNGDIYVSGADLSIGDDSFGRINMVFPLELLGLQGLLEDDVQQPVVTPPAPQARPESAPVQAERKSLDILIIGDDETESRKIADVLGKMGLVAKTLSFKDNVHNYLPGELRAIYLVMQDVNEQAFGAAIKISSSCSLPLIAAGPGWTRTKVIKAVKYGVRDILLTPASQEDIEENIANNLMKLAA